jgi:hypothetical protein
MIGKAIIIICLFCVSIYANNKAFTRDIYKELRTDFYKCGVTYVPG